MRKHPCLSVVGVVIVGGMLAVPVFAVTSPVDDSSDVTGPAGIQTVTATSNGTRIDVDLVLAAARQPQVKYRVHFDYEGTRADANPGCVTTSDDTSMLRGHKSADKPTGPGTWDDTSGTTLSLYVLYSELGVTGGATVYIWVDTHYKGIQDRAPDTDDLDGCSKPQSTGEVIELTLN